jgi:Cytochrome P460
MTSRSFRTDALSFAISATFCATCFAAPAPGAEPAAPAAAALPSRMAFPADFPAGFTEYDRQADDKTRVVTVRYANRVALEAARTGQALPTGSVIVSGDYATLPGPNGQPTVDGQGRWQLGPLRGLAGMESRSGWGEQLPQALRNGDWHYGLWSASGEPSLGAQHSQCLGCHRPLQAQSFVFTWPALRSAATRLH